MNTKTRWVLALTGIGSLMAALDTLVVSTSLITIRHDLGVWGKVQGHEIAIVGFRQPPREGGYLVVRHGLLLACPLGVASDSVASCRLGGP